MADLMTTAEVDALIRRPAETLRYWRWRGEGPRSFKVGRGVVYDRGDVEKWLAAQKRITGSGTEVGEEPDPRNRPRHGGGPDPHHRNPARRPAAARREAKDPQAATLATDRELATAETQPGEPGYGAA